MSEAELIAWLDRVNTGAETVEVPTKDLASLLWHLVAVRGKLAAVLEALDSPAVDARRLLSGPVARKKPDPVRFDDRRQGE